MARRSSKPSILSSKVRLSRLDHTRPSWIRAASGTAKTLVRRVHEQADGLQGMPHDVFGLGVGFRLLMQQLDGRHFPAALGDLDAVADQDQPAVDAHGLENNRNTSCVHSAASRSSLTPVL